MDRNRQLEGAAMNTDNEFEFEEFDLPAEFENDEELSRFRRMPARSFSSRPITPRFNAPRVGAPRPRPVPPRKPRYPRPIIGRRTYLYAPESPAASEYVRWVQTMLNQALNLQLPVDGVLTVQTRSAIRRFQEKNSLPVTGIVGPDTERALSAGTSGQASSVGPTEPAATEPAEPATTPTSSEFDFEWENLEDAGNFDFREYEFESETARPARKYPPFSLEPILQRARRRATPKQELEFFGDFSEMEEELTGARLAAAVEANRRLARQLGWGCVVNGRLQLTEAAPRPKFYDLLRLSASPSEEDFAQAVENFQRTELRQPNGDGQLGPITWKQLLQRHALDRGGTPPTTKFAPFSVPVFFGGRKLGVLEKTRAYEKCFFDPVFDSPCRAARSGIAGEGGGAIIELGFRVTDMAAVRRAGFVDGFEEDFFRWIQVVEFITRPVFNAAGAFTGFVRRASGEIDPMAVAGIPPEQLDLHPYYWDEVTHSGASPALNIDQWINRRAQNGLCYDLVFSDRATFPLSTVSPPAPWTRPGSHAYFNFELALVGVRPGPPIQNFVLCTIRWGYDIFMKGGQPTVDLNGLKAGPTNGSPTLKKILNREFNRDDVPFPGHCMAGSGYTGRANCRK